MDVDGILILAWLLVVIGFIGTLLPLLPGVPLLFCGLLLATWHEDFINVSVLTMVIIGVLTILAWAVDFFGSLITAKKVGRVKKPCGVWHLARCLGLLLGR